MVLCVLLDFIRQRLNKIINDESLSLYKPQQAKNKKYFLDNVIFKKIYLIKLVLKKVSFRNRYRSQGIDIESVWTIPGTEYGCFGAGLIFSNVID